MNSKDKVKRMGSCVWACLCVFGQHVLLTSYSYLGEQNLPTIPFSREAVPPARQILPGTPCLCSLWSVRERTTGLDSQLPHARPSIGALRHTAGTRGRITITLLSSIVGFGLCALYFTFQPPESYQYFLF